MLEVSRLKEAYALGYVVFRHEDKYYYAREGDETLRRKWSFPFTNAEAAVEAAIGNYTLYWGRLPDNLEG
jgi:hypothetical protein